MSKGENHTITWIKTPLSKFGFKCIMNKHDFCVDSLCECLCHQVTSDRLSIKKTIHKIIRLIISAFLRIVEYPHL